MKTIKISLQIVLVLFSMTSFHQSCKKPPSPMPPTPPINTAPRAHAGWDKLVYLPVNFCTLTGSTYDKENNIVKILWSKISGPPSFLIEQPDSPATKVSDLQIGIYEFEITVSDGGGLTDKDTITVIVRQILSGQNEIIFENEIWGTESVYGNTLLWGSIIIIPIYQYLPAAIVFRTYIKKDNSINWEELIPGNNNSWYSFELINGSLCIWSTDQETDTPDIKLVF